MEEVDLGDEEQGDAVDPRIQVELERLNTATDTINKLEVDLDEARMLFRQLLSDATQRIDLLAKRLGKCVEQSRPYYEARIKATQSLRETQAAAWRYERATSQHTAAREMVFLAEEGLMEKGCSFDHTWQEMLNHATSKVNDAEKERIESAKEHRHTSALYHEAETRVKALQKELKRAIAKSSLNARRSLLQMNNLVRMHQLQLLPYFELKAAVNQQLEAQKQQVRQLEDSVGQAKMTYSQALANLETISDEIHRNRQCQVLGVRGIGVGADSPLPPMHSVEAAPVNPISSPPFPYASTTFTTTTTTTTISPDIEAMVDEFKSLPGKLSSMAAPILSSAVPSTVSGIPAPSSSSCSSSNARVPALPEGCEGSSKKDRKEEQKGGRGRRRRDQEDDNNDDQNDDDNDKEQEKSERDRSRDEVTGDKKTSKGGDGIEEQRKAGKSKGDEKKEEEGKTSSQDNNTNEKSSDWEEAAAAGGGIGEMAEGITVEEVEEGTTSSDLSEWQVIGLGTPQSGRSQYLTVDDKDSIISDTESLASIEMLSDEAIAGLMLDEELAQAAAEAQAAAAASSSSSTYTTMYPSTSTIPPPPPSSSSFDSLPFSIPFLPTYFHPTSEGAVALGEGREGGGSAGGGVMYTEVVVKKGEETSKHPLLSPPHDFNNTRSSDGSSSSSGSGNARGDLSCNDIATHPFSGLKIDPFTPVSTSHPLATVSRPPIIHTNISHALTSVSRDPIPTTFTTTTTNISHPPTSISHSPVPPKTLNLPQLSHTPAHSSFSPSSSSSSERSSPLDLTPGYAPLRNTPGSPEDFVSPGQGQVASFPDSTPTTPSEDNPPQCNSWVLGNDPLLKK